MLSEDKDMKDIEKELEEARERLEQFELDPFFYNHYTDEKIRQLEKSLD